MDHYGAGHCTCHLLTHTLSQLLHIRYFTEALQPARGWVFLSLVSGWRVHPVVTVICLVPQLLKAKECSDCGIGLYKLHKTLLCPPHSRNSAFPDSTSWTTWSFLCLFLLATTSPGIPCLSSAHSSALPFLEAATLPVLAWDKASIVSFGYGTVLSSTSMPLLSWPDSQHPDYPPVGLHRPE